MSESNGWRELRPCPVCDHNGWCTGSEDGAVINCRRVAAGCIAEKTDSQGQAYWVHRGPNHRPRAGGKADDPAAWHATQDDLAAKAKAKAEAKASRSREDVDAIYRDTLRRFSRVLTDAQEAGLLARGLTREAIVRHGFCHFGPRRRVIAGKLAERHDLAGVPGFWKDGGLWRIAGPSGVAIPVRDFGGTIVGVTIRPDVIKEGGGKYKWLSSNPALKRKSDGSSVFPRGTKARVAAHVPTHPGIADTSTLRITEGALKAIVATELSGVLTVGMSSCGTWKQTLPALEHFKPKRVLIALDADHCTNPAVAWGLIKAHQMLTRHGGKTGYDVAVELWDGAQGKGIDDLLHAGGVPDAIDGDAAKSYVENLRRRHPKRPGGGFPAPPLDPNAPPGSPPPAGGRRPQIVLGTDEFRVNEEAVAALALDPELFQRGGMLVHVVEARTEDDDAGRVRHPDPLPVIRDLKNPLLRERLTRYADWAKWSGAGERAELVPAHPPVWCVAAVGERRDWPGVRPLEAAVPHPVMLPDGSVLAANGYHRGSGLLVCLPQGLGVEVPERPTRADVAAAVAALEEVVADFQFQTDAHKSAWFAGLLTPLAWFAFSGPAPMFLIDANVRAAGKGLLADTVALIATGRRFPVMSYTSDREELRKRITTVAAEGDRMVLLDNLAGAVGNDVLDAALTADRWKDRLLGGNQIYDGPLHVCWYATGNNVQLHADTARRVCHCRMETLEESPETKTGFRHPDLRSYVRAHRSRLLGAALTILRVWVVAGRPTHGLTPWGSFEGWSGVVREAIVYAGLPDPGGTRLALQSSSDCEANAMSALIAAMGRMDPDGLGVTAAEIIDSIKKPDQPPPDWYGDLRSAVEELCGRLDTRALGYKFRHFARRNFDGRMIDRAASEHRGSARWVVRGVRRAGDPPKSSPPSPQPPAPDPFRRGDGGDGGDDSARSACAADPARPEFANGTYHEEEWR